MENIFTTYIISKDNDSITSWLTSIGTIGSCIIALICACGSKIICWIKRPNLTYKLKKFQIDNFEESDDKRYDICLEVINNGGKSAEHCCVSCEQVADKIESKECFNPREKFLPKTFMWVSENAQETVFPNISSWCKLFSLTMMSDKLTDENESDIVKTNTAVNDSEKPPKITKEIKFKNKRTTIKANNKQDTISQEEEINITTNNNESQLRTCNPSGYTLYLAINKGHETPKTKLEGPGDTFLIPIVIRYENPIHTDKIFIRIHWKNGEQNINENTLTYDCFTQKEVNKKQMINTKKGDTK